MKTLELEVRIKQKIKAVSSFDEIKIGSYYVYYYSKRKEYIMRVLDKSDVGFCVRVVKSYIRGTPLGDFFCFSSDINTSVEGELFSPIDKDDVMIENI